VARPASSSTPSRRPSTSRCGTSPASTTTSPSGSCSAAKSTTRFPCTPTAGNIGERTPENYAHHAEKAVEEQEYPALKCDPFAHYEYSLSDDQIDEVADLLEAVRDAVGWDVGIGLDCHGRFSRRGAVEVANALEEYDIMFLEEPVELEDREAMAWVTDRVNMPVATGERVYNNETMSDLIEKQACDIIQPDITNYGSLQEVQHAASMAKSSYMTIAPHNPNAGVSTAASLHVCAGLENLEVLEHMSRDVPWGDEVIQHDMEVSDGTLGSPRRTGSRRRVRPRSGPRAPLANRRTVTVSSTPKAR